MVERPEWRSTRSAKRLGGVIVVLVTAMACHGDPRERGEGMPCEAEPCAEGLECALERCRAPCNHDDDCDYGICVSRSEDPEVRVCTVDAEVRCNSDDTCPGDLVCSNHECRNECLDDEECGTGRTCRDEVCVDTGA